MLLLYSVFILRSFEYYYVFTHAYIAYKSLMFFLWFADWNGCQLAGFCANQ